MLGDILYLIMGFVLLIKGADWLVDGATTIARKMKISDLAIGLTVVAFGTSMPELVVNIAASIKGYDNIVLGNIIGSNNFNLFFTLGIAGIISPLVVRSSTAWREIPISFITVVLLFLFATVFSLSGVTVITRFEGVLLLLGFVFFIAYVVIQLKTDPSIVTFQNKHVGIAKAVFYLLVGISGLVLGGRFVVSNAISLASGFGISEKIIGLTVIAMGTSLPELVTSVVAVMKKNSDIAVGNIIGSNIFNILLILAVSAIIRPIKYSPAFNINLYLLAGGTLCLFIAMFTGQKKKLDRWEALILLLIYIGYTLYLILN
jgi:cation:H+ antiporter